jgi:hypothetical protein
MRAEGFDAIPEAIFAMGFGPRSRRGWGDGAGARSGGGSGSRRPAARIRGRRASPRAFEADRSAAAPRLRSHRAIEEMTGGSYAPSPGVVYPTLTMLEDMG